MTTAVKIDYNAADRDIFIRGDGTGRAIQIGEASDTLAISSTNTNLTTAGALTLAAQMQSATLNVTGNGTVGGTLGVTGAQTNSAVINANAGIISKTASSGGNNEAYGKSALSAITSGGQNTAVGSNAGLNLTTGSNNMLFGFNAGTGVVAGTTNVCVGANTLTALDATDAIAIGDGALRYTQGQNNIGIGKGACAGSSVTPHTGQFNVAIGTNALLLIEGSVAWNNTAIGANSLTALTTGLGNLCIGKDTGLVVTTGQSNIFLGNGTGDTTTTGSSNILIGPGLETTAATTTGELKIHFAGGSNTPIISGDMVSGLLGVNTETHDGTLSVKTDDGDNVPTLVLDQNDNGEAIVEIQATENAGTGTPISTLTTPGTLTKWFKVDVNGTNYWVPLYTNPS